MTLNCLNADKRHCHCRYIEETRSTLQFASRAKLVKTNATVNEVVDDATRVKRLKKELEQLKDKQQRLSSGMSEEEGSRIEDEKNDLLARLASLQREKDQQEVNINISERQLFSSLLGRSVIMTYQLFRHDLVAIIFFFRIDLNFTLFSMTFFPFFYT